MQISAIQTRLFLEGQDLASFVKEHVPHLAEESILVVTSKIAALAESRTAAIEEKEKIIKKESDWAMPTKYVWLTIKDGMFMAAAGIDESNADGKLILLPENSFEVAARLRKILRKHYGIKKLGVILTDSRVMPLRAGTIGVAIGYAGFRGLREYRGKKDLFGRVLRFSRVDIADSLATAAVLLMGEGNEQCPLAVITSAPVSFTERIDRDELVIAPEEDLYLPFLGKLSLRRKGR